MKNFLKVILIFIIGIFLTTTSLLAGTRILEFGSNLDFSSVNVGKSATQELTLYNKGDSPLTIEKLRFHKNIAQVYSGDYSGVIPAGGEKNVTITFTPKAGMEYTGLVYVESDRTNSNDRSKLLTGVGIDDNGSVATRILACSPNILDFGDVRLGESVTKELTILNLGTAPLTIYQLRFHERLEGVFGTDFYGSMAIPTGGSASISITFVPTKIGTVAGLLYIESDRTNTNDNSWLVRANVIEDTNSCDEATAITREELRDMIRKGEDVTMVNTCKITDLSYLFKGITTLFNQDISGWDTSNVTNMNHLFDTQVFFNQNISNWDTSKVTDMSFMFSNARVFNQPLKLWNVSNVKNMNELFAGAESFNQNIDEWDVSNVTTMSGTFMYALAFNQSISSWDVSNVTDMSRMFATTKAFNQDIGGWDVSNVTNMQSMFARSEAFNQDIGEWNISNVTNLSDMFSFNSIFNQDIGNWDVSKVTDMSKMFSISREFNQDITQWDISNVTNMDKMFLGAVKFNQNIGFWNVSNVTNMDYMFYGTKAFNQPIEDWNIDNVLSYNNFALYSALEDKNNPFID